MNPRRDAADPLPGRVRPRRHHPAGRHLPPHVGGGAARPRHRRPPPAHGDRAVAGAASTARHRAARPRPRPLPARRAEIDRIRRRASAGRPAAGGAGPRRAVAHARLRLDVAVARAPTRRRPDRPVPRRLTAEAAPDWPREAARRRPAGDDRLRHRPLRPRRPPRLLGRRRRSSSSAASTPTARPTTRSLVARVTDDGQTLGDGRELRLPPDDAGLGEHAHQPGLRRGDARGGRASTPAARACSCKGRPATSARARGSSATPAVADRNGRQLGFAAPGGAGVAAAGRGRTSTTPGRSSPARSSAPGSTCRSTPSARPGRTWRVRRSTVDLPYRADLPTAASRRRRTAPWEAEEDAGPRRERPGPRARLPGARSSR